MRIKFKKCPDCWANYSGKHTCPPWIKDLVKRHKKKKAMPCPHGRLPFGDQDGWKHCPHCLGINR